MTSIFFILSPVRIGRIGFAIKRRFVWPQRYRACGLWTCWDCGYLRIYLFDRTEVKANGRESTP